MRSAMPPASASVSAVTVSDSSRFCGHLCVRERGSNWLRFWACLDRHSGELSFSAEASDAVALDPLVLGPHLAAFPAADVQLGLYTIALRSVHEEGAPAHRPAGVGVDLLLGFPSERDSQDWLAQLQARAGHTPTNPHVFFTPHSSRPRTTFPTGIARAQSRSQFAPRLLPVGALRGLAQGQGGTRHSTGPVRARWPLRARRVEAGGACGHISSRAAASGVVRARRRRDRCRSRRRGRRLRRRVGWPHCGGHGRGRHGSRGCRPWAGRCNGRERGWSPCGTR